MISESVKLLFLTPASTNQTNKTSVLCFLSDKLRNFSNLDILCWQKRHLNSILSEFCFMILCRWLLVYRWFTTRHWWLTWLDILWDWGNFYSREFALKQSVVLSDAEVYIIFKQGMVCPVFPVLNYSLVHFLVVFKLLHY